MTRTKFALRATGRNQARHGLTGTRAKKTIPRQELMNDNCALYPRRAHTPGGGANNRKSTSRTLTSMTLHYPGLGCPRARHIQFRLLLGARPRVFRLAKTTKTMGKLLMGEKAYTTPDVFQEVLDLTHFRSTEMFGI